MFTIENILNNRPLTKSQNHPRKRYKSDDKEPYRADSCGKNESVSTARARKPSGDLHIFGFDRIFPGLDGSIDGSVSSRTSSPLSTESSSDDSPPAAKRKKARTCFSNQQLEGLETAYTKQKYLQPTQRKQLASRLGLSDRQVKTWFQNRRMKDKRQGIDPENQGLSFLGTPTYIPATYSSPISSLTPSSKMAPLFIIPPPLPVIGHSNTVLGHSSEPLLKISH